MTSTDTDDRRARMILATVSEPGDTVTGTLIAHIGATETVRLISSHDRLPRSVDPADGRLWRRRLLPHLDPAIIGRIRDDMQRHDLGMLTPADLEWPGELQQLGAATPYALWTSGDPRRLSTSLDRRPAIVGARAATAYGEHVATELASGLAYDGAVIISGGAYGIDGAAHRAAIATRPGATVVVLANGLDRPYPLGNTSLFDRIRDGGGLLVSELPPGAAPTRWRLLQRNRLLAALSGATVVVEAGYRSGSLNIAGTAHTLDRPVGAVPGPVTSPASAGCHQLLREHSATVVTSVQDVTALLGVDGRPSVNHAPAFGVAGRKAPRPGIGI